MSKKGKKNKKDKVNRHVEGRASKRVKIVDVFTASVTGATKLLNADVGPDTRSEWQWVRTANGDLMLATYPHGDMYFQLEEDVERDYNFAQVSRKQAELAEAQVQAAEAS